MQPHHVFSAAIAAACLCLTAAAPAMAQHHGTPPAQVHAPAHLPDHGHGHGHAAHAAHAGGHASPYAGMQHRAIKALSSEHIAGLQAGKGMALAMAAELNGYPGPLHTLELAEPLQLTAAQKAGIEQLFADMQTQAQAAGLTVIEAERALDTLFRDQRATPDAVDAAVRTAALAQGTLRAIHLRYHLLVRDMLTAQQIATYNTLRGY